MKHGFLVQQTDRYQLNSDICDGQSDPCLFTIYQRRCIFYVLSVCNVNLTLIKLNKIHENILSTVQTVEYRDLKVWLCGPDGVCGGKSYSYRKCRFKGGPSDLWTKILQKY